MADSTSFLSKSLDLVLPDPWNISSHLPPSPPHHPPPRPVPRPLRPLSPFLCVFFNTVFGFVFRGRGTRPSLGGLGFFPLPGLLRHISFVLVLLSLKRRGWMEGKKIKYHRIHQNDAAIRSNWGRTTASGAGAATPFLSRDCVMGRLGRLRRRLRRRPRRGAET